MRVQGYISCIAFSVRIKARVEVTVWVRVRVRVGVDGITSYDFTLYFL